MAHNTPVINGHAQTHKAACVIHTGTLPSTAPEGAFAVLDLTACTPPEAGAASVTRTVWLGRAHVVVCDRVLASAPVKPVDHWHAGADLYWGEQAVAVSLDEAERQRSLWMQTSAGPLSLAQQQRLRGSRGPCTLRVEATDAVQHWWCFSLAERPPLFAPQGPQARLGTATLRLAETLPTPTTTALALWLHPAQLEVLIQTSAAPLGTGQGQGWTLSLTVNGQAVAQTTTPGRRLFLPTPAIRPGDDLWLSATPVAEDAAADRPALKYRLTEADIRQIRAIPLRVFAQADPTQISARCELQPGVLEGALEYAFYLIVDGQKTQVRWYQPAPTHCFTLTPAQAAKPLQIRGFVRAVAEPERKHAALSARCWVKVGDG